MLPQTVPHSPQDKLQRLVAHIERHQLHVRDCVCSPREWLIKWLATARDDLNGRKPAYFLGHEDFDLVLVGILLKEQTAQAWYNNKPYTS
jgi:predicted nucleotidyltransferase